MATAMTMREYLRSHDVDYEEVSHPHAVTATHIAKESHIAGDHLAKAVLLKGESGYFVAVIPSTCRADLESLSRIVREPVELASEKEINDRFKDCDLGALPPLGQAYGLPVWMDDRLQEQPDIYFEAGDHETLIHMSGKEFARLMADVEHGQFSKRA